MTDTTKQPEALRLAFLTFAKREMPWVLEKPQDDAESLCKTTATIAFQRGYEAGCETLDTSARIAELEAQLEAVGAGGVTPQSLVCDWSDPIQPDGLRSEQLGADSVGVMMPAKKEPTVPDNMQDWAGMDGAIAWHLIERHADNWADIGKMMGEWLAANRGAQPAPAVVGPVEFKGGMTAADQSRELDAGFAAQNYCRGKWGAARGHAEWRRYHDAFVAGYLAAPQPQQIAEPASQWIGVNERLPVWVVRDDTPCFINGKEIPPTLFSETVLVALKGGGVRTDKLTTIEGKSEGWWHTYGERVAAWMPAPKPPTQKDPS